MSSTYTILYEGANGRAGIVLIERITDVIATRGRDQECEIHLDNKEVIKTHDTLGVLRDRIELAYYLRRQVPLYPIGLTEHKE